MPRAAAPDSPNRQLTIDEASELTGRSRQTILNYLTIGLPDRAEHGRLAGRQLPSVQVPGRSRTGFQYRMKLGDLRRAGLLDHVHPADSSAPRSEKPKTATGTSKPTRAESPDENGLAARIAKVERNCAQAAARLEQQSQYIAGFEEAISGLEAEVDELRRSAMAAAADPRVEVTSTAAPVAAPQRSTSRFGRRR